MIEIACDESGYEGEKLIGTTTDVFAHAGVRLDLGSAADCVQELRNRIRSPATEYKANHLLREKHSAVLRWILGPESPLRGNAHVFLIDKEFLVVSRLLGVLAPGVDAVALRRDGHRIFGAALWTSFLTAANDLMRTKHQVDAVGALYRVIGELSAAGPELAGALAGTRPLAEEFRAGIREMMPLTDPLIPAIVRAAGYWGGGPISIVHDRQRVLSPARIALIRANADGLVSLRLAGSGSDPRIQVADILAGTARKIASDELNGRGDPRLIDLLRPYVDPQSIWGDDRSRPALMGPANR